MRMRRLRLVLIAAIVLGAVAAALAMGARDEPSHVTGSRAAAPACPGPRAAFGPGNHPPACWRPYAATSPFNRVVPAGPRLAANSGAVVSRLTGWGPPQALLAGHADTRSDYFHPLYWSQPGDPVFTVHCVRFSGCPIEGRHVRIPDAARPAGGADGHLAVTDPRTGWEYDFWQVSEKPRGGGRIVISYGGRTRIDRKSTRLNSSHIQKSRMPSSA